MSRTVSHKLFLNVSVGRDEIEIPVDLDFTFKPGHAATGPSYASGGEPVEAPEIEYETIEWQPPGAIAFEAVPPWLYEFLSNSDDVFTAICEGVGADDPNEPDPDEERDRRIESARLRDG